MDVKQFLDTVDYRGCKEMGRYLDYCLVYIYRHSVYVTRLKTTVALIYTLPMMTEFAGIS